MGSHFVTLHVCELKTVQGMVGSSDRAILDRIDGAGRKDHERELVELIDGTFEIDGNERAGELIRAFELLCKLVSTHSATIEMYDDEEESPLLWRLCWEGEDGVELPFSEYGTPAVCYHPLEAVDSLTREFSSLQKEGGYDPKYLDSKSLVEILKTLHAASSAGCGLFAFVEY
jgi:hypothetical protein